MSRFPGLLKRRRGFYWRIRIPSDLAAIAGLDHVVRSLKTHDFTLARVRCVLASDGAPRAWSELRSLVKEKKAAIAKGELTDDQLRRVARSWLESHRWIPETIRTAAPGDLEWQRETLPDHWIEQDAVTGDDHERWPTSVHKRAFLLQLIERQGYQTSAADADRLQPILAGMIGDMIDRRLEDLTGSHSPSPETAKPRLKPDSRKPLSGLLDQFLDIHREAIGQSTRISYRAEIERFESVVGAKAIGDIERADIVSYMDVLAKMPGRHGKTMSRATIGRALSHLRTMFGWAVMRDLASENVVQGVSPPKGQRGARAGHRRAFTDKELKAILVCVTLGVANIEFSQHALKKSR